MSVMWNDWSKSTAESFQAACSSRQFVYSSAMGKTYFMTGAVRSMVSGLSYRWSLSSRVSLTFICAFSFESKRVLGWGLLLAAGADTAPAVHPKGLAGDEAGV